VIFSAPDKAVASFSGKTEKFIVGVSPLAANGVFWNMNGLVSKSPP